SKGRGPRTEAGKAASAMNALEHGLTATTDVLLPKEDPEAFAAHCAAVEAEYAPEGPTERALVTQLALVFWRMIRVEAVEAEVLVSRERRPDGHFIGGYGPLSPFLWDARRLDAVTRYRGQLERGQFRLLKELRERRAARAAAESLPRNEPEARAPVPAAPPVRNEPEAPPVRNEPEAPPVRNEPEAPPAAAPGTGAAPLPPPVRNEPAPAPHLLGTTARAGAPANDPFVAAVRRILKEAGR
ncbi:MAG: hypothetical protein KDG89_06675, partial [Geminicoccaceae bacterium]|nr:hypothetical protein [Geminicoccaceae bacterium]